MAVVKSFCVMLWIAAAVTAYPNGAPDMACASLNPTSHGPSTAKGPSPYTLTMSPDSYTPGAGIKLTLAGAMFKGFLIEGRKAGDSTKEPVGYFKTSANLSQLVCTMSNKTGNGLTQTDNTVKKSLTIEWTAPPSNEGNIVFHYTVIRGGAPDTDVNPTDYFMDLKSLPLKPSTENAQAQEQELEFQPSQELAAELLMDAVEGDEVFQYVLPLGPRRTRRNEP